MEEGWSGVWMVGTRTAMVEIRALSHRFLSKTLNAVGRMKAPHFADRSRDARETQQRLQQQEQL